MKELPMKLNLGCGAQVVEGWVNVDSALGARLAKVAPFRWANRKLHLTNLEWDDRIVIHDLTKRFPWPDSSADVVYSSHTLEHFSKEEGLAFLEECHRVLKRDGVLRLVVPDLRVIVTEYLEGRLQADDFILGLEVLPHSSRSAFRNRLAAFLQFPHKCMYDGPRLLEILDRIGFSASSRDPLTSDIEDIELVEIPDRTMTAVVVEGHKR
jgi:ubiquinone/menaquinone biosynthesis C-methylase UbiE